MTIDPNECSMEDCTKPLGPDALEFTHNGKPAGGICGLCTAGEKAIRVLFELNEDGVYVPQEMVALPNPL